MPPTWITVASTSYRKMSFPAPSARISGPVT